MRDDTIWRGVIIEESLEDPSLLDDLAITGSSAAQLEEEAWLGEFKFVCVEVPDASVEVITALAAQVIKPVWYLHLVNGDQMKVIFRDKVFTLNRADVDALQAVVEYGIGQGIHPAQLDLGQLFDNPFGIYDEV
jgi:hypothetical protein